MEPQQQQLNIDELFKIIGQKDVQLQIINQMLMQSQQEKAKLEEELKKIKEDKK